MENVTLASRSVSRKRGKEAPVVAPPPGFHDPMEILRRSGKKRSYCGPWVLMAVTGQSYETVRASVNRVRDREDHRPVFGVGAIELCRTLETLGVRYERATHRFVEPGQRLTLASLLRKRQNANESLIVDAGSHWILVRGRKVTCAILGQWTWTSHAKKRRGVVRFVVRVKDRDDDKAARVAAGVLEATAAARRANLAKGRAKKAAMAEANRLGLTVTYERERETITVDAPSGMVFRGHGQEAEYIPEPGDGTGWEELVRMLKGMDSDALFEADPDAE